MMGKYDMRCPQGIPKSQENDDDNKHNHGAGSRAMVTGTEEMAFESWRRGSSGEGGGEVQTRHAHLEAGSMNEMGMC